MTPCICLICPWFLIFTIFAHHMVFTLVHITILVFSFNTRLTYSILLHRDSFTCTSVTDSNWIARIAVSQRITCPIVELVLFARVSAKFTYTHRVSAVVSVCAWCNYIHTFNLLSWIFYIIRCSNGCTPCKKFILRTIKIVWHHICAIETIFKSVFTLLATHTVHTIISV